MEVKETLSLLPPFFINNCHKKEDRGILVWQITSSFLLITCADVEDEYVNVLLLGVRDFLPWPFLLAHTSELLSLATCCLTAGF